MSDIGDAYAKHVRPWLARVLQAVRLDQVYDRASGGRLYVGDIAVLDFAGGYGAALFGHNHPRLVQRLVDLARSDVPVLAQGSIRPRCAELAEELGRRVDAERTFVTTLANSGAETVEAALKHARYSLQARGRRRVDELLEPLVSGYAGDHLPGGLVKELRSYGYAGTGRREKVLLFVTAWNEAVLSERLRGLALVGAFHGKTLGAVQLTYGAQFRAPFDAGDVLFFSSVDELEQRVENSQRVLLGVTMGEGGATLVEQDWTTIFGLFIEPIQGEGGVRPLDAAFAQGVCAVARKRDIPVIIDEIQTGMGRTGTFCYAEQLGVRGDYVLLGKSLGGGLAKIGALMIDSSLYETEFGRIHSSTFAEDDLSAGISLEALRVLDDEHLMDRCRTSGEWLTGALEELRTRHPDVIRDTRGRGLMIGVELAGQQRNPSRAFRMLHSQGFLPYVIAGYLLNRHRIRVVPTLSASDVMRIQPPATIERTECDALLAALDDVCAIIARGNAFALLSYLLDVDCTPEQHARKFTRPEPEEDPLADAPDVAFIGHFISAKDATLWDESLSLFTPEQLETLIELLGANVDPFVSERIPVTSATGARVNLNFIGAYATSTGMERYLRGDLAAGQRLVRQGYDIARAAGCQVLGLGGYTSIVTGNGLILPSDGMNLTTGNSLTTFMGLEAIRAGLRRRGKYLADATVGIIGASGNIASVYGELVADEVPRLVLIGRPGKEQSLFAAATRIYRRALARLLAGGPEATVGLASAIGSDERVDRRVIDAALETDEGMRRMHSILTRDPRHAPVILGAEMAQLRAATVIVAASNSAEPLIRPEHLGDQATLICDISVPMDTSEEVLQERLDVEVIQGGVVQLPRAPDFRVRGIPLEPGVSFACMAETLLMGLEGIDNHYSRGRLSAEQVERIGAIAQKHGFILARAKSEKSY